MGEEPDAHYHAQPGGLHGASHLRYEHELHGGPGEILAHCSHNKMFLLISVLILTTFEGKREDERVNCGDEAPVRGAAMQICLARILN